MNEGVATLTIDGTIVYGNSQLASMLQLPMEKLIGQRLNDFIIFEDREIIQYYFKKRIKNQKSVVKSALNLLMEIPLYL